MWNFSRPKQNDKHSHSMLAYHVSTLLRVLLAKVMGHPSRVSAVLSSYSLASVFIMTEFILSKCVRVDLRWIE